LGILFTKMFADDNEEKKIKDKRPGHQRGGIIQQSEDISGNFQNGRGEKGDASALSLKKRGGRMSQSPRWEKKG